MPVPYTLYIFVILLVLNISLLIVNANLHDSVSTVLWPDVFYVCHFSLGEML